MDIFNNIKQPANIELELLDFPCDNHLIEQASMIKFAESLNY